MSLIEISPYHPSIVSKLISIVGSPVEDFRSLDLKQVYLATPIKLIQILMRLKQYSIISLLDKLIQ